MSKLESIKNMIIKNKAKTILILAVAILLITLIFIIGHRGNNRGNYYEKKLAGDWYVEGSDTPQYTLYSDGTCEIRGEYGTGHWSIVNDDQLKLTNFYGESEVVTIVKIKNGCLTVEEGGEQHQLWNSPKD